MVLVTSSVLRADTAGVAGQVVVAVAAAPRSKLKPHDIRYGVLRFPGSIQVKAQIGKEGFRVGGSNPAKVAVGTKQHLATCFL